LRPHPVFAGGKWRKIIIARLVGENRGGDGASLRLRRHGDPAHLFARGRGDGSGEDQVLGGGGERGYRDRDGGENSECRALHVRHGIAPCSPRLSYPWSMSFDVMLRRAAMVVWAPS